MSKAPDKKWEELTLFEKLTELGFEDASGVNPGRQLDDVLGPHAVRVHAALDQLFDLGQQMLDIEEMCAPAGTGKPTGDELNICSEIYTMLHGAEDDEEDTDENDTEE